MFNRMLCEFHFNVLKVRENKKHPWSVLAFMCVCCFPDGSLVWGWDGSTRLGSREGGPSGRSQTCRHPLHPLPLLMVRALCQNLFSFEHFFRGWAFTVFLLLSPLPFHFCNNKNFIAPQTKRNEATPTKKERECLWWDSNREKKVKDRSTELTSLWFLVCVLLVGPGQKKEGHPGNFCGHNESGKWIGSGGSQASRGSNKDFSFPVGGHLN